MVELDTIQKKRVKLVLGFNAQSALQVIIIGETKEEKEKNPMNTIKIQVKWSDKSGISCV